MQYYLHLLSGAPAIVYYVLWIATVAVLALVMRSKAIEAKSSVGIDSEARLPLAQAKQQASQNNRVRGFIWGALAGAM